MELLNINKWSLWRRNIGTIGAERGRAGHSVQTLCSPLFAEFSRHWKNSNLYNNLFLRVRIECTSVAFTVTRLYHSATTDSNERLKSPNRLLLSISRLNIYFFLFDKQTKINTNTMRWRQREVHTYNINHNINSHFLLFFCIVLISYQIS